ncbi:MAG: hypothetical protein JSW52_12020 [Candidatus Coatesbacteria bacterium]|nr:MAG: hypothetical protein JSW52_12020 [Candidatus Coatesbacteria bacterium]
MFTKKANGSDGDPVYDLICGGELGPGILPADVALYLLGQVGRGTLSGGLVRFSGAALGGVCELEEKLFAEVAAAMGADGNELSADTEPGVTAVVEYDLTRLEPQVWDGESVLPVADSERPFVSVGYLGEMGKAALDAVKHILSGREVYYDCILYGLSAEFADELGLGGDRRPGPPEPVDAEFAAAVTTFSAARRLTDANVKVYIVSAATVSASMLTGRLEDSARLFKKTGR